MKYRDYQAGGCLSRIFRGVLIRQCFFKTLVLAIWLLSFDVISVSASNNPDQIKIIESNLSHEKQEYEKFDSREKDLLKQVSELEQDVAERRRAVAELGKKIRASKIEIEKMEKKQALLEQSLDETEIKAANRLIALYKYARKGYINILADVVDMKQFWQRIVYLKAISEDDREELSRLAVLCVRYKNEIASVKDQIDKKVSVEKEEKARLNALTKELEEKVICLMKTHKEKEFYETAVKELQLGAQDLKQTFSDIKKKKEYETTRSSQFEDSKNKLPFPLEGKIIRGDKFLGRKDSNSNKGIFIEGSGTEVKAIFPGRVDFSGRLKGYGELVVINHGSRSISAQLSKRLKEEGDMVKSGDVIGLVEKNGTSAKARVYFEIRKAGQRLDPMGWLKVD